MAWLLIQLIVSFRNVIFIRILVALFVSEPKIGIQMLNSPKLNFSDKHAFHKLSQQAVYQKLRKHT